MLSQADAITQKYNLEVARTPPPSLAPQASLCLNAASNWLSIDLSQIEAPAFETLASEFLWDGLREMGIQGVYLKNLKQGGEFRTAIGVDPEWGPWNDLAIILQKKGIILIGDSIGKSTGLSTDFSLALKNVKEYPDLYHLIEIEKKDWELLPKSSQKLFVNVPWLTIQQLHKKGYVAENFDPYVKESSWNATGPIRCQDGKVRRWIYLKEKKEEPVINWLSPSFAGCRIAAADTLDSVYNLGQKIVQFDDAMNASAQESLTLLTRKLGGFSTLKTDGGICAWKMAQTDLITDTLTPAALLHAFIAEDAEVLKLIYRLLLDEGIDSKRLAHSLPSFNQYACDYALFLAEPKKRFQYYEENLTGDALRQKLLKEDLARIGGPDPVTWEKLCLAKWQNNRPQLMNIHLLLALFYAMQPGAFSLSISDLLGLTHLETINPLSPNENSLYGSLPSQMKNSCSFAMQLRKILSARMNSGIMNAELIEVPFTKQEGLLVLLYKLPKNQMLQMLAINFSQKPASHVFEMPSIRQTSAIDLMSGLAEKKLLDSSTFQLNLPPLSGKVILFQTKYYD